MLNVSEIERKDCTGCGYCQNVCPKKAITMSTDEYGFIFPSVSSDKCIDCGVCIRECPYGKAYKMIKPLETYACVRKNKKRLLSSSSGGAFSGIAEEVLDRGGWYVTGCILDAHLHPVQIITNNLKQLTKVYGSKYVQSDMGDIYKQVSDKLDSGSKVLFSGTPCQCNAMKQYTNNNPDLYTIEIICHGVSSEKMFKSYISTLTKNKRIKHFAFRDKSQGWTFNNKITFENGKTKKINHRLSSYMTYYLDGDIYRDSCYSCKFAKEERCADVTIGDFWGILSRRSDLKKYINIEQGVSCLLVNTEKGRELIRCDELELFPVDYADIRAGNGPLNSPSMWSKRRDDVMRIWKEDNHWEDVNQYWKVNDYRISYSIWSKLPGKIQHLIRVLLGKR